MATKDGYKSVSSGFFRFEEIGDSIEGKLVAIDYTEVQKMAVPKYIVDTGEGLMGFLATVQLAETLARVPIGSMVYVVYTGNATSGNKRNVKQFEVLVADGTQLKEAQNGTEPDELPL